MKIEVGKEYINGFGKIVKIVGKTKKDKVYPFVTDKNLKLNEQGKAKHFVHPFYDLKEEK